jgi:hypothetical protein
MCPWMVFIRLWPQDPGIKMWHGRAQRVAHICGVGPESGSPHLPPRSSVLPQTAPGPIRAPQGWPVQPGVSGIAPHGVPLLLALLPSIPRVTVGISALLCLEGCSLQSWPCPQRWYSEWFWEPGLAPPHLQASDTTGWNNSLLEQKPSPAFLQRQMGRQFWNQ